MLNDLVVDDRDAGDVDSGDFRLSARSFFGTYWRKANLSVLGPSHFRPVLTHLIHSGKVSSHFTRRILHVRQPSLECRLRFVSVIMDIEKCYA